MYIVLQTKCSLKPHNKLPIDCTNDYIVDVSRIYAFNIGTRLRYVKIVYLVDIRV